LRKFLTQNLISRVSRSKQTRRASGAPRRVVLAILLAVLFVPSFAIAQGNPNTVTLSVTITPNTPVKPDGQVTVSWAVDNGFIGGGCIQVPPIESEIEQRVVAESCGNSAGIGGQSAGGKSFTVNETTQFILYSSNFGQVKAVTAVVDTNAPDPGPGGGQFKIESVAIVPTQVEAGAGVKVNMQWASLNAAGAAYEVSYTIINVDGKVVNDASGNPIQDKKYTTDTPDCQPNNTSCNLDISEVAKTQTNGDTTAGKATFKIVGKTARDTSEVTAELTIGRGVTADQSDPEGGRGTMFDFLRKVVAFLVLLFTSVLYYIFATIIVPLIVAVINIHPYKDNFVSFIYPGWVILRNISNIFFILALLWVGLRTLFQVDDAAKSREFIKRLIIAAIMVNFSLVIGQAIVGIADTVQAQFLPGDTEVVETLGYKLMVDPIVVFRGGSDSLADPSGNFDNNALASDLPKAIIMLVLAVAAFFAFVALIAFMMVRLAALWILYMLSPLAYVGQILPQTSKYADQWWEEFIKYAFAVPIMAFFLNITALMAIKVAPATGKSVEVASSGDTFFGGLIPVGDLAAGYVSFVTTVLAHFVILIFLFLGMHFALKFGGKGAETIVNGAKKGFDAVMRKAPKAAGIWTKDTIGDAGSKYAKDKGYKGLAAGISALSQPMITGKKLKDRLLTEPKKKQLARMEKARKPLDEFAQALGLNYVQGAKMVGWKLAGNSAKAVKARAALYGNLMTDEDRANATTDIERDRAALADIQDTMEFPDNHHISVQQAETYQKQLGKDLDEIDKAEAVAIQPLEEQRAKAIAMGKSNNAINAIQDRINEQRAIYNGQRGTMPEQKARIDDLLNNLEEGAISIDMGSHTNANQALEINARVVNANIEEMETNLDQDRALRNRMGVVTWTAADRDSVRKEAEKVASRREFQFDEAEKAERRAQESEEVKKFDGVDDTDTLTAAFKEAINTNNTALASALAKKIAKEGGFKDLLTATGFKNNLAGFQKFMEEKFKHSPVVIRNQIATELSNLNMQNGNRAVGKATSVDEKGVINWNSQAQQFEKLAKTAGKKNFWDKKPSEMFYEDEGGNNQFIRGEVEELQKYTNNREKLKRLKTAPSKSAEAVLNLHRAGGFDLPPDVLGALTEAAGKRRGRP
jgi:hypothetical protein